MNSSTLTLHLSPDLIERLQTFQHSRQLSSLNAAALAILTAALLNQDQALTQALESQHRSSDTLDLSDSPPLKTSAPLPERSVPHGNPSLSHLESPLPPTQLQAIEQQLLALSREVIELRQQGPSYYDQLRGQVAAIHLSHSGLIKNLRERLEALEAQMGLKSSSVTPPSEQAN
ncbi:hypothetical protein [Lyngbya confervoides]|uniref:CopG-like ribbon-helix-helix domain-containing protein n=1 Tax=Lyngbya confervoides BDU141951 TaxID=1574623 RepID=A0ABD4T3Q9_9CYAN|nr:hypothetical protein [Lyngbya confervoides]MCM1983119.1 hypothetical protein [Lyngbya confervoides BDU141951]